MTINELKQANDLKRERRGILRRMERYERLGKMPETEELKKKSEELLVKAMEEELRIMEFIEGIEDSLTRQVFSYRFLDGYGWPGVAARVGGGNTSDSVRKIVERYIRAQNKR